MRPRSENPKKRKAADDIQPRKSAKLSKLSTPQTSEKPTIDYPFAKLPDRLVKKAKSVKLEETEIHACIDKIKKLSLEDKICVIKCFILVKMNPKESTEQIFLSPLAKAFKLPHKTRLYELFKPEFFGFPLPHLRNEKLQNEIEKKFHATISEVIATIQSDIKIAQDKLAEQPIERENNLTPEEFIETVKNLSPAKLDYFIQFLVLLKENSYDLNKINHRDFTKSSVAKFFKENFSKITPYYLIKQEYIAKVETVFARDIKRRKIKNDQMKNPAKPTPFHIPQVVLPTTHSILYATPNQTVPAHLSQYVEKLFPPQVAKAQTIAEPANSSVAPLVSPPAQAENQTRNVPLSDDAIDANFYTDTKEFNFFIEDNPFTFEYAMPPQKLEPITDADSLTLDYFPPEI